MTLEKYLQCVKGTVWEGINVWWDIEEEKISGFKGTKIETIRNENETGKRRKMDRASVSCATTSSNVICVCVAEKKTGREIKYLKK